MKGKEGERIIEKVFLVCLEGKEGKGGKISFFLPNLTTFGEVWLLTK